MSGTLAHAIKVLEERASVDEAVAEAVLFLAGDPDGPADPFLRPDEGALAAARAVNRRRMVRTRADVAGRTLDTADVVALIESIHDRKGVDRRRRRGQLLGWRAGARTLHPTWQFDVRRGDTRPGLARVLAALAEVVPDGREADALMTARRDDLDGRTLADLLADGRVETVVQLVRAAGDQG
jgi:hypothetical protein